MDVKPPVWRRIQVPETYTFRDLHVAIQDAMGWSGCHLHEFRIAGVRIGIPDEDMVDREILPEKRQRIAEYVYDSGDGWEHRIALEKILPRDESTAYPVCISGRRACPPEDCGGASGYESFLEAMRDPEHPEHEEALEWAGGEYDPESFDPEKVQFDDPAGRWRMEG